MKVLPLVAALSSCLFLSAGCLSKPPLMKETFVLTGPGGPAGSVSKNPLAPLGIKSFSVAPVYENRSFLYRISEETFEQDPYAELLVPPSRLMPNVFRSHLRATGVFRSIIEPGSFFTPVFNTEITVSEFYGDLRKPEQPTAVLTMRFLVIESASTPSQEPFFQGEITRHIPIPSRTAAALAGGWNQALKEIAEEFATTLRSRP